MQAIYKDAIVGPKKVRETMEIPNEEVWEQLTKEGGLENGLKRWMEFQGAGLDLSIWWTPRRGSPW